jgi:hypothetical protein
MPRTVEVKGLALKMETNVSEVVRNLTEVEANERVDQGKQLSNLEAIKYSAWRNASLEMGEEPVSRGSESRQARMCPSLS